MKSFIVPDKRDRWIFQLASTKGRRKLRFNLDHCSDFMSSRMHQVSTADHTQSIYEFLKSKGAPLRCTTIAVESKHDAGVFVLRDLLDDVYAMGSGVIMICIPDQLAYYEPEHPDARVVLWRGRT